MATTDTQVKELIKREYEHGFVTEIESDTFEPGLNEDVIRRLSELKQEPEFMLEWRLKAYRRWLEMDEPEWAPVDFPKMDYNSISYYSAPKRP
ncbi:MAG: Fe-S cluster assembly protein SufB, partial [Marinobacter sp.]